MRAWGAVAAIGLAMVMLWASASPAQEAKAGLEALSEGNGGIAAKHPGDAGIEKDAEVIFADDFEASEMGAGPKWDTSWDQDNRLYLETSPEGVHSGKKAIAMTMTRANRRASEGCDMIKLVEPGVDKLFLRYYVKFEKGTELFHGGAHNGATLEARGPEIYRPSAGIKATGTNKFMVCLDTWRPWRDVPSPGNLEVYVYHPEQVPRFGEQWFPSGRVEPVEEKQGAEMFGARFTAREDFIPERDKWYCFEMMVKANEAGKRDGRIAFWVDGKLRADFPDLRLRDAESLKINRISMDMFCNNRMASTPVKIWYDDLVAGKSYIGPMRAKQ